VVELCQELKGCVRPNSLPSGQTSHLNFVAYRYRNDRFVDENSDLTFSGFYINLMSEYSQRIQFSRMTIIVDLNCDLTIFLSFASLSRQITIVCCTSNVDPYTDKEWLSFWCSHQCQELKGCVRPNSLP